MKLINKLKKIFFYYLKKNIIYISNIKIKIIK